MALDLQQELKQAHALLDQLPPAKLGAVRSLLEVMLDDGEPVSDDDITATITADPPFAHCRTRG